MAMELVLGSSIVNKQVENTQIDSIHKDSLSTIRTKVDGYVDDITPNTGLNDAIARNPSAPNTITQMSNQLKNIGSVIGSQPQTSYDKLNSTVFQNQQNNSIGNLEARAEGNQYKYHEYFKHIHGFEQLFDPSIARQYAHTFFVETLYMLCANATDEATLEQVLLNYNALKSDITNFRQQPSACPPSWIPLVDVTKTRTQIAQSPQEQYKNFVTGLTSDVRAQHSVNMNMLVIDSDMRKEYLDSQLTLITTVAEQQNGLIESLTAWSHYLNQQAQEYAHLYETLSTHMTTYKRKDVFDIQESKSLDVWNDWSSKFFWLLVVVLVLMLVVQHYRSLSKLAGDAEKHLKDTASRAYDAITHVESK